MKKYASAALLALQLTLSAVIGMLTVCIGLQVFSAYRWLMPGGVPLQATFGFETLLRDSVQSTGKTFCLVSLILIGARPAAGKGSKTIYTMNRLGLSELQVTLVFGAVFCGYYLLFWALELALCYGLFVWYSRYCLVSSNAWMLACWRSEWLHTLLPLGEWWGYLRNLAICGSFGFTAALGSQVMRRGRFPMACLMPPLFCLFLLSGRIGSFGTDLLLTVALVSFTVTYYFAQRGGREDEDL